MDYDYLETPIGRLLLVADEDGLRCVDFPNKDQDARIEQGWQRSRRFLGRVIEQLDAYFAGDLHVFDVALAPRGTAFRKSVWDELLRIPYGETISYGELARRIRQPQASRAVGAANGANPLPIIVPCHRVIGSSGKLTGFGGGLPTKQWLLEHERRHAPRPSLVLQ
ncbi:methylated-DNA--[protein]-cysteine S-methyltransferase [Dokdonella sp.]|uniref:methylated-DNA--[protein]-cysteine S-methyltransferase n=1 Tax=Dokdonella sp. TaxID=2291710 RepID=UPI001B163785|nr:methylated-DNA--[protein]-cysteine S-methyltransferase [Dokdonella sp.]MBO9662093.1 methylated-DNA--[protein]-cysteine S-methyltransferase [Dokdonella sp.]